MPYLKGEALRTELDRDELGHEPLIEELIFKDTASLFFANTGVGKSVFAVNMAVAAVTDKPVFGYLRPAKKLTVAYLQTEGSRDEQLGRIQAMENTYGKIDHNRLSWHVTPISIEDRKTWDDLLKELDEVRGFDLFFIDPIVGLTAKKLVAEEFCHNLRQFQEKIRAEFGCAVVMTHHTPKDGFDPKTGGKVKRDSAYGLQWLDSQMDAMYYLDATSPTERFLERRKNRGGNLIENLTLSFDIANWSLSAVLEKSTIKSAQRVAWFLQKKFDVNGFATTTEICQQCNISRRHLRRMKQDGLFDHFVTFMGKEKEELTWVHKKTH